MKTRVYTRLKAAAIGVAGAAGLLMGTTVASQADGYAPARYAPGYSWTGVYAGVSAGGEWDDVHWQYTNPVPSTCCAPFSNKDDRFTFGGHFGVQYQWSKLVLGVEVGAIANTDHGFTGKVGCVNTNPTFECETRTHTIWTLGPRLGFASGNWLFYGTGGVAAGYVDTRGVQGNGTLFDYSVQREHDGWFGGGGVEFALARNLVLGVEYIHVDLDQKYHASSADGFSPSPPGVNGRNIDVTEDVVRARLSFKINPFDQGPAPLK
jgi:outer membrane immunogenic protein